MRRGQEQSLAYTSSFPLLKLVRRVDQHCLQVYSDPRTACQGLRRCVPLNMVRLDMFACEHDEDRIGGLFDEQAPAGVLSAGSQLARGRRVLITYHSSSMRRSRLEVQAYLSTSLAIVRMSNPITSPGSNCHSSSGSALRLCRCAEILATPRVLRPSRRRRLELCNRPSLGARACL